MLWYVRGLFIKEVVSEALSINKCLELNLDSVKDDIYYIVWLSKYNINILSLSNKIDYIKTLAFNDSLVVCGCIVDTQQARQCMELVIRKI